MKRERKTEEIAGIQVQTDTRLQTPADSYVPDSVMRPLHSYDGDRKRVFRKGHGFSKSYSSDDPRIARVVAYGIGGVLLGIGLLMLLLRRWFFGICFTAISLFALIKAKRDIDEIARKKGMEDATLRESLEAARSFGKGIAQDIRELVTEETDHQANP